MADRKPITEKQALHWGIKTVYIFMRTHTMYYNIDYGNNNRKKDGIFQT